MVGSFRGNFSATNCDTENQAREWERRDLRLREHYAKEEPARYDFHPSGGTSNPGDASPSCRRRMGVARAVFKGRKKDARRYKKDAHAKNGYHRPRMKRQLRRRVSKRSVGAPASFFLPAESNSSLLGPKQSRPWEDIRGRLATVLHRCGSQYRFGLHGVRPRRSCACDGSPVRGAREGRWGFRRAPGDRPRSEVAAS